MKFISKNRSNYEKLHLLLESKKVNYKINFFMGSASFADGKCGGDSAENTHFFSRNQIGIYKFNSDKDEYILDEKTSTITKDEIITSYIPDALSDEVALKVYKKEFSKLAKSKNYCKTEWFERWSNFKNN